MTDTTAARRQRVAAALTAEHYRRAREHIVASPEEHSAAMAAVAVAALDGPSDGGPRPARTYYRAKDEAEMHAEFMAMQAAIARARERCKQVRDRVGPGGMINASQILGLLSLTWPDGNYESALDSPSPTPGWECQGTDGGMCFGRACTKPECAPQPPADAPSEQHQ